MTARRTTRRRDAGSAYLIVLLALVVLTILGLSLATITGLEMEVGANERGVTRTFYSADSGINVAAAQALTSGQYRSRQLGMFEGSQLTPNGNAVSRGSRVEVSPFVPILVECCNLCGCGEGEKNQYFKVNHAVTSIATELSWNGNDTTPPNDAVIRSQKTITVMIEFQPWKPSIDGVPTEPAELAKVKF